MEHHREMLGDGLAGALQCTFRMLTVRPRIGENAIKLLPDHDSSGAIAERVEEVPRAFGGKETLELPGIAGSNVIEIPTTDPDGSTPRCSRSDRETLALTQGCGLEPESEFPE